MTASTMLCFFLLCAAGCAQSCTAPPGSYCVDESSAGAILCPSGSFCPGGMLPAVPCVPAAACPVPGLPKQQSLIHISSALPSAPHSNTSSRSLASCYWDASTNPPLGQWCSSNCDCSGSQYNSRCASCFVECSYYTGSSCPNAQYTCASSSCINVRYSCVETDSASCRARGSVCSSGDSCSSNTCVGGRCCDIGVTCTLPSTCDVSGSCIEPPSPSPTSSESPTRTPSALSPVPSPSRSPSRAPSPSRTAAVSFSPTRAPVSQVAATGSACSSGFYRAPVGGGNITLKLAGGGGGGALKPGAAGGNASVLTFSFFNDGISPFQVILAAGGLSSGPYPDSYGYAGSGSGGGASAVLQGSRVLVVAGGGGGGANGFYARPFGMPGGSAGAPGAAAPDAPYERAANDYECTPAGGGTQTAPGVGAWNGWASHGLSGAQGNGGDGGDYAKLAGIKW